MDFNEVFQENFQQLHIIFFLILFRYARVQGKDMQIIQMCKILMQGIG